MLRIPCFSALMAIALPAIAVAQLSEQRDGESTSASEVVTSQESARLDEAAATIVAKTNAFRKEEGLEPQETNDKLTATAVDFAAFMARTDKYGHYADGQRPADRVSEHGYEYCMVAENIAYQYKSNGFATGALAERFVTGWKESPGHRKNMLKEYATETGVGIARSKKTGVYYAVQLFGRPQSLMIEIELTNNADAEVRYKLGDRTFTLPPRYTRTHQRCHPTELVFYGASDEPQKTLTPEQSTSLEVVTVEGEPALRKQ